MKQLTFFISCAALVGCVANSQTAEREPVPPAEQPAEPAEQPAEPAEQPAEPVKAAESRGDVNVVRRQVAMFSEEQAGNFLRSVATRQLANERLDTLRKMLNEKTGLRSQVMQGLETYGWEIEGRFQYVQEERVIRRLPSTNEEEPVPEEQEASDKDLDKDPEKGVADGETDVGEVVYTFNRDEDIQRFSQLLVAKRNLDQQVSVLTTLLDEQQRILNRVGEILKTSFNVDPESQYHYDNETRTLYLLSNVEGE